jgi:hypothetical protein
MESNIQKLNGRKELKVEKVYHGIKDRVLKLDFDI